MDREHRRELRHDKFVDEVGVLSDKAVKNQRLLITIAAVGLAIALIAYGIYFYRSTRERKAQSALASAIETIESPLLPPAGTPPPGAKHKTEAEKSAAAEKEFKAITEQYGGTDASDVAKLYLARISAARGDSKAARQMLEDFIGDQPRHVLVGAARYSLYQLRIELGEAPNVVTELNAELAREEPALPTDSLLVLLAKAYEAQGNEAKSRDTYRRIVTEHPESPFALEAQRRSGPA